MQVQQYLRSAANIARLDNEKIGTSYCLLSLQKLAAFSCVALRLRFRAPTVGRAPLRAMEECGVFFLFSCQRDIVLLGLYPIFALLAEQFCILPTPPPRAPKTELQKELTALKYMSDTTTAQDERLLTVKKKIDLLHACLKAERAKLKVRLCLLVLVCSCVCVAVGGRCGCGACLRVFESLFRLQRLQPIYVWVACVTR